MGCAARESLWPWHDSHLFEPGVTLPMPAAKDARRAAGVSAKRPLSLACEQGVKFVQSLTSLTEISTCMLVIFLVMIVTEWQKPLRLH